MIKDNTVVTGYFTDPQESQIIVILERPDGTTFDTIIEAGDQSEEYRDLLEQCTLEELRQSTVEHQKLERDMTLKYAESIFAEERSELENDMIRQFVVSDESSKEFAFKVKLAVFQKEEIKNATTEQKKEIRSAESPLEVIYLAAKLILGKD